MNNIAFVFFTPPHGNSAGREGLDALLATSALSEEVGVFFIGDGVFQILAGQQPNAVLGRDYIVTFKLLSLYGIKNTWVCSSSMKERGLKETTSFILDAKPISSQDMREMLSQYDIILTF